MTARKKKTSEIEEAEVVSESVEVVEQVKYAIVGQFHKEGAPMFMINEPSDELEQSINLTLTASGVDKSRITLKDNQGNVISLFIATVKGSPEVDTESEESE